MSDESDSGRESPVVNYRPRPFYHHPKLIDNDQNTKLHYAASQNDVTAIIKYLDKESHIVDPQNYLGWTPLMMACRKGHMETVKCLLSYRANATKKNKYEMNVFQIAIVSGNLDLVEYLLEHFLTGGISRRILEHTFSVASLAILFRHQSILEFLIGKHFKINEGSVLTGITPFMFAHALENDAAISTLLKHKVDTKVKNCIGHTAVDIATIRHQMKVVHSNDHRILAQKLAATATQESIHNEIQNQQLRNVLQMQPAENNTPSPSPIGLPTPQQFCSPHPQVPYIIYSSYANSPGMKFLTVPGQILPHSRKSSNLSPFPIPPPPNVTPISPAAFGQLSGHQVFFPPDFANSPLNMTSQAYNNMASQSYSVGEFLNARFNSSAGMFLSPPVLNFLSPCM